ncbi:transcription repressor OFP6-like [Magnolia sinica]|uniref:transcription repressor OFP6-like n=1 Tax=Magnolia sinica TaxID=86752 RepID=UPI0026591F4B|nr:transcription repressor OFP6-like [Magnolia sinica]
MSSVRRKLRPKPNFLVDISCGCRRPKLSDVYVPRPKYKPTSNYWKADVYHCSSSSSWEGGRGNSAYSGNSSTTIFSPVGEDGTSSLSYSDNVYTPTNSNSNPVRSFGRIGESVAVVKDSNDPYLDFQHSILQMIIEKEIYSKEDLCRLLECFLSLNPPANHEIIVRAFTEIWNGVFPPEPRRRLVRRRSRDL